MKIKSNIKNNYFTCMNEAMGVNINKNYVLQTHKNTDFTYVEHILWHIIILLLVSAIFAMFKTSLFILLSMFTIFSIGLYLVAVLIVTLMAYQARKRVNFKNEIEISKEGITDTSYYGIKMTLNWDQIEAIVVRKNTIIILTNTPLYFYFDKNKKKDIINTSKKFKEDILIIE